MPLSGIDRHQNDAALLLKKITFHEGNEHVDTYFPVYQIQGTKQIKDKTLSFKAHLVKWEVLWLNKASKTQFHAHLLVADRKRKEKKKIN